MSYGSKKNLVSVGVGVALMVGYAIYAFGAGAPECDDVRAWAIAILIFIGIGVAATIIVQVGFHVAFAVATAVKNEADKGAGKETDAETERIVSSSMVEDERAKLIETKSTSVGYTVAGIGFVASLAAAAFGAPIVVALHVVTIGFAVGSLAEGVMRIYYDVKGVRNG